MKRKLSITALIFSIIVFVMVLGLLTLPDYNCDIQPGPHYCSLEKTSPRLIERLVGGISEDIQVTLGGTILNLRQDLISTDENKKAVDLAKEIYNEMNLKSEWNKLPSALGITYEKIIKLNLEPKQYFAYIPQNEPTNAIVYLHGFGGNFKSYTYLLSKVADQTSSIIIAPTYKSGVWDFESIKFIDSTVDDFLTKSNLKIDKFSLIGLSNGGLIFPEYIQNSKYKYSNIIAISTYLDPIEYSNPKLINRLSNTKFTYIYGTKDTRVGIEESLISIKNLNNTNITKFEGSDHVLFFEKPNEVLKIIKNVINL